MSRRAWKRALAAGAVALLAASGATGSAYALSGSSSGSVTLVVPAALKAHELCVSSKTTGKRCEDVPGVAAATLKVSYQASANGTPPSASVAPCAVGAIVTVDSGGGTLSGSARVEAGPAGSVTVPIAPTSTPGDAVTVSFCEKP